ncbi:dTDP-4-dehydrorhamnose 3,5-epimerase [Gelidibacter algens]|uniref:dTDP-4-dehydrorhamnose 3,5-epimerase n=1 Tax=Gelidibacter algens TaxID=49280 RepID=A0A1A7QXL8_9FLAO|nr:dTDP-4-dehydrorhamnose 3,5-epimerase [Gelidibacter algens]OBX23964.1 dTDP-4-dehydrorhamnose 3,5-epimerase [Gelidibacter algens]RAJ24359.1 dTDP-4-dehydrorhamnose 3,5-epimerase [Gelidibacter algens]
MEIEQTYLNDCYLISPRVFADSRGTFFESFNKKKFEELTGHCVEFVQDNQSTSQKGVLRGLHFQMGNFAQAKLVRVIQGSVLDVAVDIRPQSETLGQHFSLVLSAENNKQLYIPQGFAHGFLVLEDDTIFSYKCDSYYNKASEGGIIYNDKSLNIDWKLPEDAFVISEKDKELPTFETLFK